MPAGSTVSWKGLEKMILDLQETIPRQCSQSMSNLTQDTGETMLLRYQENLEGTVPSTASDPLPVGMRSGDLYDGANLRQINQYAFELSNDVDYSGWIEMGTEHMAPRHPLQDAVDITESEMDVTLDDVAREIFDL